MTTPPVNRAELNTDNNLTFHAYGNNYITGAMLQNWNNQAIVSFGVLIDANTWTGVNNFTQVPLVNGQPITALGNQFIIPWAAGGLQYLAPDDLSPQFLTGDQPLAVNQWVAIGARTGIPPTFLAQGSDANVFGNFAAQGMGGFNFGNGSGQLFAVLDCGGAVNAWPAVISATGIDSTTNFVSFTSSANSSYSNIVVSLVGVGNYGAALGDNNRPLGTKSWCAGSSNYTTGYATGATGVANTLYGSYSFCSGQYLTDNNINGSRVHGSVHLGTASGTSQIRELALAANATGTEPAVITSMGSATASFTNSFAPLYNSLTKIRISVAAIDTTAGANRAYWEITAGVYCGASASTITIDWSVGTGAPSNSTGTGSGWTVTLAANVGGFIVVTFTGTGSNTYRVVARVETAEVAAG